MPAPAGPSRRRAAQRIGGIHRAHVVRALLGPRLREQAPDAPGIAPVERHEPDPHAGRDALAVVLRHVPARLALYFHRGHLARPRVGIGAPARRRGRGPPPPPPGAHAAELVHGDVRPLRPRPVEPQVGHRVVVVRAHRLAHGGDRPAVRPAPRAPPRERRGIHRPGRQLAGRVRGLPPSRSGHLFHVPLVLHQHVLQRRVRGPLAGDGERGGRGPPEIGGRGPAGPRRPRRVEQEVLERGERGPPAPPRGGRGGRRCRPFRRRRPRRRRGGAGGPRGDPVQLQAPPGRLPPPRRHLDVPRRAHPAHPLRAVRVRREPVRAQPPHPAPLRGGRGALQQAGRLVVAPERHHAPAHVLDLAGQPWVQRADRLRRDRGLHAVLAHVVQEVAHHPGVEHVRLVHVYVEGGLFGVVQVEPYAVLHAEGAQQQRAHELDQVRRRAGPQVHHHEHAPFYGRPHAERGAGRGEQRGHGRRGGYLVELVVHGPGRLGRVPREHVPPEPPHPLVPAALQRPLPRVLVEQHRQHVEEPERPRRGHDEGQHVAQYGLQAVAPPVRKVPPEAGDAAGGPDVLFVLGAGLQRVDADGCGRTGTWRPARRTPRGPPCRGAPARAPPWQSPCGGRPAGTRCPWRCPAL